MKSIIVSQKKRGRPSTGETPRIGVRMDDTLIQAIEAFRAQNAVKVSQSEVIRHLLIEALKERGFYPK